MSCFGGGKRFLSSGGEKMLRREFMERKSDVKRRIAKIDEEVFILC